MALFGQTVNETAHTSGRLSPPLRRRGILRSVTSLLESRGSPCSDLSVYVRTAQGVHPRVVRLLPRDGRAVEERAIPTGIPGGGVHYGCHLKFGRDGNLYLTTGDAGQSALAQRRDSLAGKVLRVNPDGLNSP